MRRLFPIITLTVTALAVPSARARAQGEAGDAETALEISFSLRIKNRITT